MHQHWVWIHIEMGLTLKKQRAFDFPVSCVTKKFPILKVTPIVHKHLVWIQCEILVGTQWTIGFLVHIITDIDDKL